ncbi:MAG: FkbM family methyltransferase [Acidimicrobiia bacterium]|nr:FkbM family methyltransferase [Acidimicrobiia bacterium]
MSERAIHLAGVSYRVDDTSHPEFWDRLASGTFEPATVAALAALCGPGRNVVDVGAWLGPFTLLAAALGARVLAYEPDPVARAGLWANLALNPTLSDAIEVRAEALWAGDGSALLDGGDHGLGNSLSSLSPARTGAETGGPTGVRLAEVRTVDAARAAAEPAWRDAAVVKIDIEGGEYTVVPALAAFLAEHRPSVLLSLHSFDLRDLRYGRFHPRTTLKRLAGARRRVRLFRALRHYGSWHLATGDAGQPWRRLSRRDLAALAVRLSECDLLLGGPDAWPQN